MGPDKFFFSQLSPFYHYNQASLILYCEKYDHIRFVSDGAVVKGVNKELVFNELEKVRSSSLRFIRYHQAETLLTVLCGSYPHGPVIRFSRDPRIKLIDLAHLLSEREIPERLQINLDRVGTLDFDQWIAFKMTRSVDQKALDATAETSKFIQLESAFFSKSKSYMSFKHGCMIGPTAPGIDYHDKDGQWNSLINFEDPIAWINCELERGQISQITMGAEELNRQGDLGIILISALIVNSLKSENLNRITGSTLPKTIPNNLMIDNQVPKSIGLKLGRLT